MMHVEIPVEPRLLGHHYKDIRARLMGRSIKPARPAPAPVKAKPEPKKAKEVAGIDGNILYARRPNNEPTLALIFLEVRAFYGVSHEEFVSGRRVKHLTRARHVAMYLAKTMTDRPVLYIARRLGRDHATVLHGVRIVGERMLRDRELADEIEEIKRRIAAAVEQRA